MTDHPAISVITLDRVNGAPVHGAGGTQIGVIDHLVIEKVSGRITCAVMSFGGFLGLWGRTMTRSRGRPPRNDPELGGYVTGITEDQLRGAPERPEDWARDRRFA